MTDSLDQELWDWFSGQWFSPETLLQFNWENYPYLYLLLAVPLIFVFRKIARWRSQQKLEVAFRPKELKWSPQSLLRFVPDIMLSLCLICLVLAVARPQRAEVKVERSSEGIDILLILDVSESMRIEDFRPNRLEASKQVAIDFLKGRDFDRIGLVVFSGKAYSLSPLTTDYDMLEAYVSEINHQMIPESGTAIGSALGVATNRLRESQIKSKVIILISDGDNTAGSLDPLTASQLAAYYGIKIYTILVGKDGKVPLPQVGNERKFVENTIDESTLREIAKIGEGQFFRASNNETLNEVFEQIDALEKTEITETRFKTTRDYYRIYVIWGILFWLIWMFLKSTFIQNVLED